MRFLKKYKASWGLANIYIETRKTGDNSDVSSTQMKGKGNLKT